jgi:hypothetical protein
MYCPTAFAPAPTAIHGHRTIVAATVHGVQWFVTRGGKPWAPHFTLTIGNVVTNITQGQAAVHAFNAAQGGPGVVVQHLCGGLC